jgi:hypothetical protein
VAPQRVFGSWDAPVSAAGALARAARFALVGLLAPDVLAVVASSMGFPLPRVARMLLLIVPPVAFAASGAVAASAMGLGRRGRLWMTAGFAAAALTVAPAYGILQGLTGRESIVVAVLVIVPAFAVGFAAAAAAGALAIGVERRAAAAVALRGALAGSLGGLIALLPFLAAAARLLPGSSYARPALVVASALGCLILPYRLVGSALDAARPDEG